MDEPAGGLALAVKGDHPAVLGLESAGVGIHLVACVPVPIEAFEDEGLTVFVDGHLPVVERAEGEIVRFRDTRYGRLKCIR